MDLEAIANSTTANLTLHMSAVVLDQPNVLTAAVNKTVAVLLERSPSAIWLHTYNVLFTLILFAGLALLFSVIYHFLWRRRIVDDVATFALHICVSDAVHLLTAVPVGLLRLNTDDFWEGIIPECQILYPVYALTAGNFNLFAYVCITYTTYAKCRYGSDSVTSVGHSLMGVCWFICFFLFVPQIFVEDLTQELQTCQLPSIEAVVTVRAAYWVGMTYIHGLLVILVLILTLLIKLLSVRLHHKSQPPATQSMTSVSSQPLEGDEGQAIPLKSLLGTDREHSASGHCTSVCHGSNSSSKASGTTLTSPRMSRGRINARVRFTDDIGENGENVYLIRRYALSLTFWLLAIHITSIILLHIFFYGYYFGSLHQLPYHFHIFICAIVISLLTTILNPILFTYYFTNCRDLNRKVKYPSRRQRKKKSHNHARRSSTTMLNGNGTDNHVVSSSYKSS